MTMATDDEAFPLWTFSLDRYGRDGVAETCLWMQQRFGVDVNIVLASLHAGNQGKQLSKAALLEIVEKAPGEWHREVVMPLRLARIFIKSQFYGEDAGPIIAFRTKLKELELAAERWEQRLIARQVDSVPIVTGGRNVARRSIALDNLGRYLFLVGVEFDGEVEERAIWLVHACVS